MTATERWGEGGGAPDGGWCDLQGDVQHLERGLQQVDRKLEEVKSLLLELYFRDNAASMAGQTLPDGVVSVAAGTGLVFRPGINPCAQQTLGPVALKQHQRQQHKWHKQKHRAAPSGSVDRPANHTQQVRGVVKGGGGEEQTRRLLYIMYVLCGETGGMTREVNYKCRFSKR